MPAGTPAQSTKATLPRHILPTLGTDADVRALRKDQDPTSGVPSHARPVPTLQWIALTLALAGLATALVIVLVLVLSGVQEASPGGATRSVWDTAHAVQAAALLVWPTLNLFAVVRGLPWLAIASAALFTGHAALFGLSVGGLHFPFSIPLVWAAALVAVAVRLRQRGLDQDPKPN